MKVVVCLSLLVPLGKAVLLFSGKNSSNTAGIDALQVGDASSTEKSRPVTKVIVLLKDMLAQLNQEQADDEDIYDKMECWCTTNDREKTEAIEFANQRIKELTSTIEEKSALIDQLDADIAKYREEVRSDEAALMQATELRKKEKAEFDDEERELLEAITAVKSAVAVLAKHNALLQVPKQQLVDIANMVQDKLYKYSKMFQGVLTPAQKHAASLLSNMQKPAYQSYAPRSSEIFGILQQMQETFESNLDHARQEETAAVKAFEELKEAKQSQITAGEDAIATKQAERADSVQTRAEAEQDKIDTEESLSADEKYLRNLKIKCELTDKEWEQRKKTRSEEMAAVSEAISILNSDAAFDTFTKTFTPSLLQEAISANSKMRADASGVLAAAAAKSHNSHLATIAVQVSLDSFTKVKEAIDKMIAELQKEKQDEITQRDWCIEEFNKNDAETQEKEHQKDNYETREAHLESTLKTLTTEIDALTKENEEMQAEMKKAGESREAANQEFQTTVADQQETQQVLKAALSALKEYYHRGIPSLVQQSEDPVGPPPPEGFEAYEKNANAPGVIGMLESILSDAATMEGEARKAEEDAQTAYETFTKDSNQAIKVNLKSIVDKTAAKAKAETNLVETKEGLASTNFELEHLASYKGQVHASCDFVMDNFDIRQTARDEEVEALRQAKAILAGAK